MKLQIKSRSIQFKIESEMNILNESNTLKSSEKEGTITVSKEI